MSRNLIVSSPRIPVLNKKIQFVAQSGYKFQVPLGVKEIFITGVAAGGLGGQASGSHTAFLNWAASGSQTPRFSSSENGAFIFATDVTANSSIVAIDPVTRRVNRLGSVGSSGSGRGVVANNGLAFFPGGTNQSYIFGPNLQGSVNSSGSNVFWSTNSSFASIHPCEINTPQGMVRAVFRHQSSAQTIFIYQGSSQITDKSVSMTHLSGQDASISAIRNINGRHVLLSKNSAATPKMQMFHIDSSPLVDASVAANWSRVAPAGNATDLVMNDIAYGNGVYVIVCQNGKIYSAVNLDGPWIERTSGLPTSGNLYGIKFFSGRFVAGGTDGTNGVLTTSIDGINWTATTSGLGTSAFTHHTIQYDYVNSRWAVMKIQNNGDYFHSSDGTNWTLVSSSSLRDVLTTRLGLLFGYTTNLSINGATLTDTGDGGDFAVMKNGVNVLTLAGGAQQTSGGSSVGLAYSAGDGSGGSGGLTTTTQPTGTGGVGGANRNGGGGSLQFMDLLSDPGSWGIKIPGASAGASGTSGCGGGASIFFGRYGGPGSGANSVGSYAGGGAGEGIVRYRIDVDNLDSIVISTGLGGINSVQGNRGFDGVAIVEWENV